MTLTLESYSRTSMFEPVADDPASGAPTSSGTHLPALDAIRGLAILMVTAYRFNHGPSGAGTGILSILDSGFRGVDLFFVLSGFLITGILYDAKERPNYFRKY